MKPELSSAAYTAAQFINQTKRHVFLTGKAGTGKTTFLKYIIENTHKKSVIVAPTGIAAINAGGATIHSTFQLPFGTFVPVSVYHQQNSSIQLNDKSSLFRNHRLSSIKRELIRETELLIIDEVSMLRADLLDAIDAVMRHVRGKSHLSFGGAQVLFIGDLFQLPPVVKEEEKNILAEFYKSPYFFDAQVLSNDPPVYIELDKIYRQNNPRFIDLLNNLRNNTLNEDDANLLNEYYQPNFKQNINDNYIYLTTHNYKAQNINSNFLGLLKTKTHTYEAEINGDYPENLYPIDKSLVLKEGAQVMFVKNDLSGKQAYFNGKIARIKSLSDKGITVEFEDGKEQSVGKYTWENKRFVVNPQTNEIEDQVLGEFKHYPLKLAWAITVHKSQGLTFTKAIVDVADAFAPGQVYVALSRLRDMSGLVLSSPINFRSLKGDATISEFAENSEKQNELQTQLDQETLNYLSYYLGWCYDFSYLKQLLNVFCIELKDHKSKAIGQKFRAWLKEQDQNMMALNEHANKFSGQLNNILSLQKNNWKEHLGKRVNDAELYFTPLLKDLSSGLLAQIERLKEDKRSKVILQEFAKLEVQVFEQIKKIRKSTALCHSLLSGANFGKEEQTKLVNTEERKKDLEEVKVEAKVDASTPLTHPFDKLRAMAQDRSLSTRVEAKGTKKEKGKKKEKGDSQKFSFDLFRQGMGIEEIAKTRNLVVSTVEGHLAHYVASGELKLEEVVAGQKIQAIRDAIAELNTESTKLIREKLGEGYTYGEIRLVLATYSAK
jgi:nucleoside-triphosphatase THEP1